jgi:hypothetical protein
LPIKVSPFIALVFTLSPTFNTLSPIGSSDRLITRIKIYLPIPYRQDLSEVYLVTCRSFLLPSNLEGDPSPGQYLAFLDTATPSN